MPPTACMICWLQGRAETEEIRLLASAILGRLVDESAFESLCDRHEMQFVASTGFLAGLDIERAPLALRPYLQLMRAELNAAEGPRADSLRLIAATVAELEVEESPQPAAGRQQEDQRYMSRQPAVSSQQEDQRDMSQQPAASSQQSDQEVRRVRDLHTSRHRPRR